MNDSEPAPRSSPPVAPTPACDIQLQNPCGYPEAGARRIRPWLTPIVSDLAPGAEGLVVRFVSDREMQRLSREFRNKDRTTDVLSFVGDFPPAKDRGFAARPQTPDPSDGPLAGPSSGAYLGDVVISVPKARRQAQELGHSIEHELRVLLLHGLLHCMGYDHELDDGTMERVEQRLRHTYLPELGS